MLSVVNILLVNPHPCYCLHLPVMEIECRVSTQDWHSELWPSKVMAMLCFLPSPESLMLPGNALLASWPLSKALLKWHQHWEAWIHSSTPERSPPQLGSLPLPDPVAGRVSKETVSSLREEGREGPGPSPPFCPPSSPSTCPCVVGSGLRNPCPDPNAGPSSSSALRLFAGEGCLSLGFRRTLTSYGVQRASRATAVQRSALEPQRLRALCLFNGVVYSVRRQFS